MLQFPYCIESMPNGSEGHSCEQSALKKIREPKVIYIKREFFFMGTTATVFIVLQCGIIGLRFKESQEYTDCYKIKRIGQKSRSELQMQEKTSITTLDDYVIRKGLGEKRGKSHENANKRKGLNGVGFFRDCGVFISLCGEIIWPARETSDQRAS